MIRKMWLPVMQCVEIDLCKFVPLYCADNTKIDTRDKTWKIGLLMNLIKNKFLDNFIFQKYLVYDELVMKHLTLVSMDVSSLLEGN